MKYYTFEKHLEESLKDPEFKKIWEDSQTEYQIMKEICDARIKAQITQEELSKKSGITQADLSRIENGNGNPSIRTLKRIATALGCKLQISFVSKE